MVIGNAAGEGVTLKRRRRLDGLTAQQGEEGIWQLDGLTGGGRVWMARWLDDRLTWLTTCQM